MSPRYFYGIKGFLGNPVENHWSCHWNLIQPGSRFGEFWTTILSPLFSEERITPSFCRRNLTLMRQNLIHQKHWQNTFTTWTSGFFKAKSLYRVCHGFGLLKRDDYFKVTFDHFWSKLFLKQLDWGSVGACVKTLKKLVKRHQSQTTVDICASACTFKSTS